MRIPSLVSVALLCAAACGCATAPQTIFIKPPVDRVLPARLYREFLRRYTRHDHVTHDFDSALDADAILMTAEYRAALVGKIAAMRNLPPTDRDRFAADQAREAEEYVDCLVMLQTSRWDWNDLAASNSVWTITFHDDEGRSVQAKDRLTVDWKVDELIELVPEVTPFTRAWHIRFPRTFPDGTPLLRPLEKQVAMKFSGPLGVAWFRWEIAER